MGFTFFFRDLQTINMITDMLLPSLEGRRQTDIWDAGCAMGPEPYTLAIVLREKCSHHAFRHIHIHATDLDPLNKFGEIVTRGIYPIDQIKRLPKDIFARYFTPHNGDSAKYKIRSDIHNSVSFNQHDLLTLQPIRKEFSLIVCKNVLLHFTQEQRIEVFKMYHDCLIDDGYMVNENTQRLPDEVSHLFKVVAANAQIFQKVRA